MWATVPIATTPITFSTQSIAMAETISSINNLPPLISILFRFEFEISNFRAGGRMISFWFWSPDNFVIEILWQCIYSRETNFPVYTYFVIVSFKSFKNISWMQKMCMYALNQERDLEEISSNQNLDLFPINTIALLSNHLIQKKLDRPSYCNRHYHLHLYKSWYEILTSHLCLSIWVVDDYRIEGLVHRSRLL